MRVKYIFRGAFRSGNFKLVQGGEYDLDKAVIDLFPGRFEIIEKPKKAKKAEAQDVDTE